MTPAINYLKKNKIEHTVFDYQHNTNTKSYGLEAAEKLNLSPDKVFKTLVVSTEGNQLAVAIIPVTLTLNMKNIAKVIGCKKVNMADPKIVERVTGYVLGGVSPLGQKKGLPTIIDSTATLHSRIFVSAGKRGLEIEICPNTLSRLLKATLSEIGH